MKTARAGRAPTIRDVAREAGVSVATVSRVLNQLPDVSLQTREHVRNRAFVQQAVEQLRSSDGWRAA